MHPDLLRNSVIRLIEKDCRPLRQSIIKRKKGLSAEFHFDDGLLVARQNKMGYCANKAIVNSRNDGLEEADVLDLA